MTHESKYIDPFSLPDELRPSVVDRGVQQVGFSNAEKYEVDLHDRYDWLAQPCVEMPQTEGSIGRPNES